MPDLPESLPDPLKQKKLGDSKTITLYAIVCAGVTIEHRKASKNSR